MKEAFVEIDKKYKLNGTFSPSVTLIVVLKRHNTRFRSTTDHRPDTVRANDALFGAISPSSLPSSSSSSESMHSANLNIPPGTLVDHPSILGTDHEFFLCSHHSNQGTIRSTHYYVLLNEMNLNKSQLCRFSYYLCYLFAKCTKSISIPAPVKYAHLAAYRARQHLSIVSDHESSTDSGASSTGSSPTPSQLATPGPLSPFARPSFRHLPPLPSHLPPPPIGWPPMLPPSSSAGPSPPSPVPSSFSPDLLLPPTFFLHQLPPRPPPFPPMQWRLPLPPGFPMRPPSFSPGRPWLVPPSPRTASARIESRALRKSGPRSEPPSLQATARTTLQLQSLIQVKPDLRLTFYFI